MAQLPTSGIKLFRLFGIQVYLHWTWFLVAIYGYQIRRDDYASPIWPALEYLALFLIVLMHEFGHALACRSVGGRAERIMLWPLGGVAFVQPPQRPGAVLWSLVAGPLVNVILVIPTLLLMLVTGATYDGLVHHLPMSNLQQFAGMITVINLGLLVFNLLPIYPLDGGQILRALLWFLIGARRSLMVATVIGLIGAGAGLLLAFLARDMWLVLIAAFAAIQSWAGFQRSRMMQSSPTGQHANFRCPYCRSHPPAGPFWTCPCGRSFDVFQSQGVCPNCGGIFTTIPCPACQRVAQPGMWVANTGFPVVASPTDQRV
jgi:Zn-dependent protease